MFAFWAVWNKVIVLVWKYVCMFCSCKVWPSASHNNHPRIHCLGRLLYQNCHNLSQASVGDSFFDWLKFCYHMWWAAHHVDPVTPHCVIWNIYLPRLLFQKLQWGITASTGSVAQLTICASKPSTNQKTTTNESFGTGEICCKVVGLYVNSPAALIDDCWGHFCIAGMEGGTEICYVKPNAVTFLLQLSLLYRSWWVGLHFINLLKDMSAKLCKTLQSRLYAKTLNHNPTLETFSF